MLTRAICERILARLAALTIDERRRVTGLQPDRAPTIVAGVAMLVEVFEAFGLDALEVSEHDILRGAALRLAARRRALDTHGHRKTDERPNQVAARHAADTRGAGRGDPSPISRETEPDIGPGQPFDRRLPPPGPPIRPRKVRTPARPAGPA